MASFGSVRNSILLSAAIIKGFLINAGIVFFSRFNIMLHHLPFYLLLIVFIMLLVMLAKRINVAYPIILVLGGLAISLIPAMPVVEINHELIFFVFCRLFYMRLPGKLPGKSFGGSGVSLAVLHF